MREHMVKQNQNHKPSSGVADGTQRERVFTLALTGVFTALVCVFTMYVQVQLFPAKGGLVHLGNVPLFFAAAFLGKKTGALCGGFGMALSDLLTPWAVYAPISFLVVSIMGFVFALIVNRRPTPGRLLAASAAVLLIKIAGYYVGEVILLQSLTAPLASIPGNVIQIVTGAAVAIPIIMAAKPAMVHMMSRKDVERDV